MSDVCVIILNWNGWEDTIGCLESILPAVRQGRASAVIVDNASSDCSVMHIDGYMQTTAVASHLSYLSVDETDVIAATCPGHDLVLIRSHRNSGYAGGNNLGLKFALNHHSDGFAWVLNNDTVVKDGAIEELLTYAERSPRTTLIGSTIVDYYDRETVQCAGGATHNAWLTTYRAAMCGALLASVLQARSEPRLDYICGAAMLIPVQVLREVGLFSPSYFLYYEEIDYARRAAASGYGLGWCRGSIVFHKGGASAGSKIGGNARKSVTAEYHSNLSALKYTRKFHPGILPVAFVSRLCLKVVHAAISHDLRLLRPLFEAYRDFLLARETS